MISDADIELACMDLEEKDAFDAHYDSMPSPDDEDELPPVCERGGEPFGGAAIKVGGRWVCSSCEEPEYREIEFAEFAEWYTADLQEDQATQDDW